MYGEVCHFLSPFPKILFCLFQVIHGLLDRTMQLLEVPYSEDKTSVHGYHLKAHEGINNICAPFNVWKICRKVFGLQSSPEMLSECFLYFQTFRFLYNPYRNSSVEWLYSVYYIFVRSLIHSLARPLPHSLTYLYFRWNLLPWSLCANHRQRKADRNHGSFTPWSR